MVGEALLADPHDPPEPVTPGLPPPARFPATLPTKLAAAAARAQNHLAGLLQRDAGASLLVTAESAGDSQSGGCRLVLRADGRQYLYYVRGNDVVLANESYQFPQAAEAGAWHAIDASAGLPGDHNADRRVSDGDLSVWRASFGADAAADADDDGDADGADFLSWQRNFGRAASLTAAADADFDDDADADGADFLNWQRAFSGAAAGSAPQGDADRDGDADAADLRAWAAAFGPALGAASVQASASAAAHAALVDAALAQWQAEQFGESAGAGRPLVRLRVRALW
ncbi:MAG: hypothetical protein DCC67_19690 [Planctomycetota bacterium]|nr:MAG: hypothetical protein DCC67_19690 [Planctomycetota bacterium]